MSYSVTVSVRVRVPVEADDRDDACDKGWRKAEEWLEEGPYEGEVHDASAAVR